MKKFFGILILFYVNLFSIFALEIPENFYGIWEGKDRFVFFDINPETQESLISIYLKEYYGWYIDRTAEPDFYSKENPRSRNAGSARDTTHLILDFLKINKNQNEESYAFENAWEIKIQYSKNQVNLIPVCVLDDKMYLNFFIQDKSDLNLYRGNIKSKGLMVSEQSIPENIGLYYFDFNAHQFVDVRYWQTDMEYDDSPVLYSKNGNEFYVDKHLKSAGNTYSCVNGKSKKIRNPVAAFSYSEEDFLFSQDKSLLITDKEPYLYKLADHKTLEDLYDIVKKQNSMRKPDPKPLFPPSSAVWHWEVIELLEKDNQIIQQVRQRQKDFGPRGH